MKRTTLLVIVLLSSVALAPSAFAQTAPYDPFGSTPESYRERAIRTAALSCFRLRLLLPGFPHVLPQVDNPSDAAFAWLQDEGREGYRLAYGCNPNTALCRTEPRVGDGQTLSCAELRLPPVGATLRNRDWYVGREEFNLCSGCVPEYDNVVVLPSGYSQYGEPPGTSSPPATPAPTSPAPTATSSPASLEVPGNGSFQSGIGYVSGWVCDAERVDIIIDGGLYLPPVSRGMSRGDTEAACGDRDNGFILLWNWNLMGDGQHTAELIVDGRTVQSNTFTVTTLGEEFVTGVEAECTVEDFPSPDEDVLLRWQQGVQGFVIVPTED